MELVERIKAGFVHVYHLKRRSYQHKNYKKKQMQLNLIIPKRDLSNAYSHESK